MITDLGPTRIGVSPDKVWFQGSSRDAETYKATPLSFAPEIDLRHIRLAYINNIGGARYLFFRATGHVMRPTGAGPFKRTRMGKGLTIVCNHAPHIGLIPYKTGGK